MIRQSSILKWWSYDESREFARLLSYSIKCLHTTGVVIVGENWSNWSEPTQTPGDHVDATQTGFEPAKPGLLTSSTANHSTAMLA